MEKVFKFLFVGTGLRGVPKWAFWALLALITVSINEHGGNDGQIYPSSALVLVVGALLVLLSLSLTAHYSEEG